MSAETWKPRSVSGLVESEIDGDISLYNPHTETVTVLNTTASDVWRLCDGDHSSDEIIGLLAAAYGVDRTAIATDVSSALEGLKRSGLIEPK